MKRGTKYKMFDFDNNKKNFEDFFKSILKVDEKVFGELENNLNLILNRNESEVVFVIDSLNRAMNDNNIVMGDIFDCKENMLLYYP